MKSEMFDAVFYGQRPIVGDVLLHVVLDVENAYSKEELELAASRTIEALPILGCTYKPGWWRDRWCDSPTLPEICDFEVQETIETATEAYVQRSLDPLKQPPWRVVQMRSKQGSRLIISVLHQLADAAGTLTVVQWFGMFLRGEKGNSGWGHQPMKRGLWQVVQQKGPRDIAWLLLETVKSLRIPFQYFRMAKVRDRWNETQTTYRYFAVLDYDAGPQTPLRQRCRTLKCTMNDALVAILMLANKALAGAGKLGVFFTVNWRRSLPDTRPRVANLSGITMVYMAASDVLDFPSTVRLISRMIGMQKARFSGLPAVLSNIGAMGWMPHSLLRIAVRLWTRWALSLLNRGVLVTNFGDIDHYIEPYGDNVVRVTMLGPWVAGAQVPLIVATGFRHHLALSIHGFSPRGVAFLRDTMASLIESQWVE